MTRQSTPNGNASVDIAREAYLYLFPLVLMDVTRRVVTNVPAGARAGFGPMNTFTHMEAFPPGDFKEVIRPNFDTLYSLVWFDVKESPVVISVPDTEGRYYMLPLLDMWTDVFGVIGSRTTGTGVGHFAIVGPDWDGRLPAGIERIESPTPIGWILGRTQANGVSDYDAVHQIQQGFRCTRLPDWPGESAPDAVHPDDAIDMATAPVTQVLEMPAMDFFRYGADLMAAHRPHATDYSVLFRMAHLGLTPGSPFPPDGFTTDLESSLEGGAAAARQQMQESEPRLSPVVNGWGMPTSGMGVYGVDYLRRAIVAKIGLGANQVEDAIYPVLYHDEAGATPQGNTDYVLHFDADKLPPADAFWSVTMYDADGFPVLNALDRYALGDRDPLNFNEDGSLDLFIQQQDPGGNRTPNWLPAPDGPMGITLRLYNPRPEALDGRWAPPPLQRA